MVFKGRLGALRPGDAFRSEGLHVGPTFQPMKQIFLSDTEALAVLELPEAIASTDGDYRLHPALLTGAFQAALISNRRGAGNHLQYIPIGMDELDVVAPIPSECYIYCRPRRANARTGRCPQPADRVLRRCGQWRGVENRRSGPRPPQDRGLKNQPPGTEF